MDCLTQGHLSRACWYKDNSTEGDKGKLNNIRGKGKHKDGKGKSKSENIAAVNDVCNEDSATVAEITSDPVATRQVGAAARAVCTCRACLQRVCKRCKLDGWSCIGCDWINGNRVVTARGKKTTSRGTLTRSS